MREREGSGGPMSEKKKTLCVWAEFGHFDALTLARESSTSLLDDSYTYKTENQ